jgi:hypothetical protein
MDRGSSSSGKAKIKLEEAGDGGSAPLRESKRLKARVKKEEEDATVPHIKHEPHVKSEPGPVVKKEEPLDIKPKPEAVSASERRTRVLEAYQRIAAFSLDEPGPPGATATFLSRYKADFMDSVYNAHQVGKGDRAMIEHPAGLCIAEVSAGESRSRST